MRIVEAGVESRTSGAERLRREAGSLGELLDGLRSRISPVLIGQSGWERLSEVTRGLPVTMAAAPFGFELPLHEPGAGVDLGVTVGHGTRDAAFFEERGRLDDADSSAAGIAWLLGEAMAEESPLRGVVDDVVMLEYDIRSAPRGALPDPAIFLYPRRWMADGRRARLSLQDLGAVLDALERASGWGFDPAERRQVEWVALAGDTHAQIGSAGVFPSRGRGIRLAATGFRDTGEIVAYLEHAGWTGERSIVASTVSRIRERHPSVHVGVHVHVRACGVAPRLGLSLFERDRSRNRQDPRSWLDDPRRWTALVEGVREVAPTAEQTLSELAAWPSGVQTLLGKSGAHVLLRGIHHIKLVLVGDRIEQAKGYVYLMLLPSR